MVKDKEITIKRMQKVVLWVTGTLDSFSKKKIIPNESFKIKLSNAGRREFKKLVKNGFIPETDEIMFCLEDMEDNGFIDRGMLTGIDPLNINVGIS